MNRLRLLIAECSGNDAPYLERLKAELDKARVLPPKDVPGNVVTMNSIVRIKDLDTGEEKTFALVFPGKAGAGGKAVSILAPIGIALIGYKEGDIIEWHIPGADIRLQIMEIVYQPERLGNYDL